MTPDPTGDPIEAVTYEPEFYRLTIDTVGGWSLTIENDFVMQSPGSPRIESTANVDQIVSLLTTHIGLPITGFDLDADGAVTITLDDVAISVGPAPDYEAWHLVGPGPRKQRIICMPGGELAIWS